MTRSVSLLNAPFSRAALLAAAAVLLTCAALRAESVGDLITTGDAFDRKLQGGPALQCYLRAEKLQPANVALLVSIARQYRHLMTDAATRAEKLRLGGLALDYSRRAAAAGPNDSDAQLALGITHGKLLPLQGKKEQVAAAGSIKGSADRAIALNARNDTAWHILGRWHRVLADMSTVKRALGSLVYGNLPTTTNEAALACFEKAIAINPSRLMHHIELGRVYAQMGRQDDARRALAKGLAMPDVEKDDPETKQRGRETLATLR